MHVRLNVPRFLELCEARGWDTDTVRAQHLGVDRANLGRLIRQERMPSAKFIAALRLSFPTEDFDSLFESVAEEATA